MSQTSFVALLLAVLGPLLALARVLRLPESLVLVATGVAAAFLPGLPPLHVDPQLMLELFLPPVLYASTVQVSLHLLRVTAVSGLLVGILLSAATIAAVTSVARFLFPGLGWSAAVLLGVVAALFDTRLFHEAKGRPHVPRAISDALKAREMAGRVIAITVFALAIQSLTSGPPSPGEALGRFAYAILGGAATGMLIGRIVTWLRERVQPAPVEIAVSLATPYLSALAAQELDLSVVVAVIAAALTVSAVRIDPQSGTPGSSAEARISAMAFWEEISLLLSAILFFVAGYSLPEAMRALQDWPVWQVASSAAAILTVVLAVQLLLALASTVLPSIAAALWPREGGPGATRLAAAGVMAWASTRSVIGLILALSIPAALPDGRAFAERDLILVVASFVILGSVLLQGLTLGPVVRAAALGDEEDEMREEKAAERAMTKAHVSAERGDGPDDAFDAERRALLALREQDRIGDEVQRKMLRETDLRARTAEGDTLPAAGPPNP